MRKQTDWDDSNGNAEGEARPESTRRQEPRSEGSAEPVACSGFTLPISSQRKEKQKKEKEEEKESPRQVVGKCGIDWFQLAACIRWDEEKSKPTFERLQRAKEVAQETRCAIPIKIGPNMVSIVGSGVGGGRDAYKEFRIRWNDVEIGLSERNEATRQFSNGSLQVSGAPCLIVGAGKAWDFFVQFIQSIGGTIEDEWLRRLDICVDVPGLSFAESLYPVLQKRQIVTRCREESFSHVGASPTGYSIGKSNRLRVLIYDKLHESLKKHNSVYLAAMMQRRWGGLPANATRIEWQLGRPWFKQFGLDKAQDTMKRMPDVFAKLSDESGGAFRITSEVPDAANKHQSRAATHPIWQSIVEIGRAKIGAVNEPLKRLDRTQLDESRAIMQIIGYTTSIADRRQTFCENKIDVLKLIADTMSFHGIEDDVIANSFMRKARASGTLQDILSFPGKEAA